MADEQRTWIDTNPGPRNTDRRQRDSLFCRPCKRLRVFVTSHIFHKCQQTSKELSYFPRRYRETLSNVLGKCLFLHEQIQLSSLSYAIDTSIC